MTANSYQLENLEEFTDYEVKMAAVNDVGSSQDTPIAVEKTRESGRVFSVEKFQDLFFRFAWNQPRKLRLSLVALVW